MPRPFIESLIEHCDKAISQAEDAIQHYTEEKEKLIERQQMSLFKKRTPA